MKITFIGATHEVTGSCYYLEAAGHKFLVDCGMEQGPDYYENAEIPVALGEIEFVLLTHAHIDHSGNLPAIYAKGFRGPVYAQMPPAIYAILCSETVRIFRCLKQNGETVKADDRANRNLFRLIQWKMPWE